MKRGWRTFRLRHTKGPDSDMQAILRATLDNLRIGHNITHTTDWVRGHQDDEQDIRSFPKEVALNIRMDAATKAAYELPQLWLTQEFVSFFPQEGCAVYIDNVKVTSSLYSTLSEHWHMEDARSYLLVRHGITDELFWNIHWPSLRFSLKKFSYHRRATLIKALHRHLPTQSKLYKQGRIAMSSLCPRCLHAEETHDHIYCCPGAEAVKQRRDDWKELIKQLGKNRTSLIILRAWQEHLLPVIGLPPSTDITATRPVIDDDISYMLHYAIQDQTEIGWSKLLLGLGSKVRISLQSSIDSQNPRAPQRRADDWLNSTIYSLLKFSL